MKEAFIGIDNGPTGSIGILPGEPGWQAFDNESAIFFETPVIIHTATNKHTKTGKSRTRHLDAVQLYDILAVLLREVDVVTVILEHPLRTPHYYATISAFDCWGATRAVLDLLAQNLKRVIQRKVIDSKTWQHIYLPGAKGSEELKRESRLAGERCWPALCNTITKHGDADGLWLALYGQEHPMIKKEK